MTDVPVPDWLDAAADGCIVRIHAQPGARRSEIVGTHSDALKIRVAAPPVDGKANETLIAFLAERLAVPRRQIVLMAGGSARRKRFRIIGLAPEIASQRLADYI